MGEMELSSFDFYIRLKYNAKTKQPWRATKQTMCLCIVRKRSGEFECIGIMWIYATDKIGPMFDDKKRKKDCATVFLWREEEEEKKK